MEPLIKRKINIPDNRLKIEDLEQQSNFNMNNKYSSSLGINNSDVNYKIQKKSIFNYPQPVYFINKKTDFEKFCDCCLSKLTFLKNYTTPYSYYLTKEEISAFNKLCNISSEYFENQNSYHEEILSNIEKNAINTLVNTDITDINTYENKLSQIDNENINFDITKSLTDDKHINTSKSNLFKSNKKLTSTEIQKKTPKLNRYYNETSYDNSIWRKLGFQSNNPRTDFRAGGLISVKFIDFFITNYNHEFEELTKIDCFLYAIYLSRLFIGVYDIKGHETGEYNLSLKTNKIQDCTKYQLKIFCKYLLYNENFLLILNSKAMIVVKKLYYKLYDNKLKEMNFTFVDKAIYEGGIKFIDYFLNQNEEINKLELDEYLDRKIESFCYEYKIN